MNSLRIAIEKIISKSEVLIPYKEMTLEQLEGLPHFFVQGERYHRFNTQHEKQIQDVRDGHTNTVFILYNEDTDFSNESPLENTTIMQVLITDLN